MKKKDWQTPQVTVFGKLEDFTQGPPAINPQCQYKGLTGNPGQWNQYLGKAYAVKVAGCIDAVNMSGPVGS